MVIEEHGINQVGTIAVSVIVPIYNCASYIGECLGSLKAQTFADFEVLCVDDGSTDGSLDVARVAVVGDDRFWFGALSENRGQSAARNVALDRAQGEYLVLLDSD
ncbi:MAG: glycosyltransferase family A protein, partial [Bacteroides sp.]